MAVILLLAAISCCAFADDASLGYSDRWSVHVDGGHDVAKEVAEQLGFQYHGQVSIASCGCVVQLRLNQG